LFEAVGGRSLRLDFAAGALDGFGDAGFVEGLEDVVHRVYVERLHGVVVESRRKDHVRDLHLALGKLLQDAKAVEAGHLHIEKDQVGRMLFDQVDGLEAVLSLRDQVDFREAF
jgi:hypothetical protein